MTVYVDDAFIPYRRMKMSHMMAHSETELHAMAKKIGIKKKWFQGDHYDICKEKRELAIENGARKASVYQMAAMRRQLKEKGYFTTPEESLKWWARYFSSRTTRRKKQEV